MNHIFYKNRTYSIPSNWNELTGKQLVKLMPVFYSVIGEEIGKLRIFQILSGWSAWRVARITGIMNYRNLEYMFYRQVMPAKAAKCLDQCHRLMEAIHQLTEFFEDVEQMNLTENKLPQYKGFYGPADQLSNLKGAEVCFSELHYIQWKRSERQGISYLNQLVATLYRPKRKNYDHAANTAADHREIYNPNLTAQYVKSIERWPLEVRLAIVTFYEGARKEKLESNPEIFKEDQGEDISLFGLWSVLRQIAIKGHFGDFDKVQDQYWDTIIMELQEVKAEADKLENKNSNTHE